MLPLVFDYSSAEGNPAKGMADATPPFRLPVLFAISCFRDWQLFSWIWEDAVL
jgi:hypothetical protein